LLKLRYLKIRVLYLFIRKNAFFIALNDERRVIDLVHNMRPHSLQLHTVPNNTTFAIEINAGYIKRNNIELGDRVMFR
jgi:uncharacterized membrane protein (UPF0127 family)